MNKIFNPIWIFLILIISGCGSTTRIYSDLDETGRFDQYATYSFLDFTDGNKKTITEMELEKIRIAMARELELRGLRFVETGADVSVQITVYHREMQDRRYGHPWRYNFLERAIAIDMYDNGSRQHVWHCAAVDELEYNAQERAERLPLVAAEIFSKYPVSAPEKI